MAVRPIRQVKLWNHRPQKAEALAAQLAAAASRSRPCRSRACGARCRPRLLRHALDDPIVHGAWLRPGAHLDLVGAFNLGMREADDEALRRASIWVDTPAAKTEGGDVALG
jgi:ornithine cyclodeaminase